MKLTKTTKRQRLGLLEPAHETILQLGCIKKMPTLITAEHPKDAR